MYQTTDFRECGSGENLGSLGAYAINLSEFLRTFEYAYYLRTLDWGVILRNYPSDFQIFQEARPGKYDLLETVARYFFFKKKHLEARTGQYDPLETVARRQVIPVRGGELLFHFLSK